MSIYLVIDPGSFACAFDLGNPPRHPYFPDKQELWQYKNFARYDSLQIDRASHGAQFTIEADVDENSGFEHMPLGTLIRLGPASIHHGHQVNASFCKAVYVTHLALSRDDMLAEVNEGVTIPAGSSGPEQPEKQREEPKPRKGRRDPDAPKPPKKEKTPEQKAQTVPWLDGLIVRVARGEQFGKSVPH